MNGFINSRHKLMGHLPRLAMLQEGKTPYPVNCEIDLSNRCQLGCSWCHFSYTHVRGPLTNKNPKPAGAISGGDLMDTKLAFRIVEELEEAGVKSISWTGGGEPLLHRDHEKIFLHANSVGLDQGIYTNGVRIDKTRAELLKSNFSFIYISLDAADPEAYLRDKGVPSFQAACNGISKLIEAEGDATIGVGYLITKDNWQQTGKAVKLFRELGADYIQFRPTIFYEQDSPNISSEDNDWINSAISVLSRFEDDPKVEVDLQRFRMYQNWKGHGYKTCYWSTLQTCITPNGLVWVCVNKREHPGAALGDLSKESFKDIWARHKPVQVTSDCRIMCRGHIPNLALDEIMTEQTHGAFI